MNLPNSIETESAILGAILIDNDMMLSVDELECADFDSLKHQKIFGAMQYIWQNSARIDFVTVANQLPDDDLLAY